MCASENRSSSYRLVAERLLAERRARNRFIGADLLGEPAWDILLTAYLAATEPPPTVVEACTVGDIPFLAGFRWFKVLEGAGLMERSVESPGETAEASITEWGRTRLESYFDTILSANGTNYPNFSGAYPVTNE